MAKLPRGVARANHGKAAKACRRKPNEWVYVHEYRSLYVARSMCQIIRGLRYGGKIIAYRPNGTFDGRFEMTDTGWAVYAMYLGEEPCASIASP